MPKCVRQDYGQYHMNVRRLSLIGTFGCVVAGLGLGACRQAARSDSLASAAAPDAVWSAIEALNGSGDAFALHQGRTRVTFDKDGLRFGDVGGNGAEVSWKIAGAAARAPHPLHTRTQPKSRSTQAAAPTTEDTRGGFDAIGYDDVVPGARVVVESRIAGVKYSVYLDAGAHRQRLKLRYDNVERVRVSLDGASLVIESPTGVLRESGLRCHQTDGDGGEVPVACRFESPRRADDGGWEYAIAFPGADPSLPLVIDPTIDWVAYYAGRPAAATMDASGALYIASELFLSNAAVVTGTFGVLGSYDTQVSKIDASGSIQYAVVVGGAVVEYTTDIFVDAAGNAYVTVISNASAGVSQFPEVNAVQSCDQGGNDAAIFKLDPTGSSLVYSTCLGGTGNDQALGVAADAMGNAYVVGYTDRSGFPITAGAYDPGSGASRAAFVTKLAPDGALVYSTLLGTADATETVQAEEVAVDALGNPVLVGWTDSPTFPVTAGAFATSHGGGHDAFVASLSADGTSLLWSTYLGGALDDAAADIAIDGSDIYVVGHTASDDFPVTAGAFMPLAPAPNGFISRLDSSGSTLTYSSLFGGSLDDTVAHVVVEPTTHDVFIAGWTYSDDFPLIDALNSTLTPRDSFVARLSALDLSPVWSTYLDTGSISNIATHDEALVAVAFAYNTYSLIQWGPTLPTNPSNIGNNNIAVVRYDAATDRTPPSTASAYVNDGYGADLDLLGGHQVSANWGGFVDDESGVYRYEWAIGTSPGAADVMSWRNAGANTHDYSTYLNVPMDPTHYVTVRAYNTSGFFATAVSDGFKLDVSAPSTTGAFVNEGTGSDIDLQTDPTTIAANWGGFSDLETGIDHYTWAIGTTAGASDVRTWTDVGTATSASDATLSLSNIRYYVSVRAHNGAGVYTQLNGDGVSVDATPPSVYGLQDGTAVFDIDYQSSLTTMTAEWSASDTGSGLLSMEVCIGTTPGGSSVKGWQNLGIDYAANITGLSLITGTTYYLTVRVTDVAGNVTIATTDGVTADGSAPSTSGVVVNDGAGTDIDYLRGPTTGFIANWSGFADSQSGIASYEWAVGTSPGASNTLPWVSTTTTAWSRSITLVHGTRYYTSVRATNGAGLVSAYVSSDGFVADNTSPTFSVIMDGSGTTDIDYQTSTTTIAARWAASDPDSGIAYYMWAIGTDYGTYDVQYWTDVGLATSAVNTGLSLTSGTRYFVFVQAVNRAGGYAAQATDGVVVDTSAPAFSYVFDGTSGDVDVQASLTTLSAYWYAVDYQSGIASYAWAVGSTPGATNIQGWIDVGTSTSATNNSLSLVGGTRYYVTVRATNRADLASTMTSDGVVPDATAPTLVAVRDGLGADVDFQSSTSTISANWEASDAESGVATYAWAIGTSPGGTQLQPFYSLGNVTSATRTGLALTVGTRYYVTVRATNGVSLSATASSNGVVPDSSAPVVGAVNDGVGVDVDFQTTLHEISANWSGSDPESGIASYAWAIGTSPGAADVRDWGDVGLAVNASDTSVALTSGVTYFVTVRARNGAGAETLRSSDGVRPDDSAPTIDVVNDGNGADIDFQQSVSSVSASWVASDPQSDIASHAWAIGTSPGANDVRDWTDVGTSTSASAAGLALVDGTRYYVSVRARNSAGLEASASSDGFVPDASAPLLTAVNDGAGADVDFVASLTSLTSLTATWQASDSESGVVLYEWAIGTSSGATDVQDWSPVGTDTTATNPLLNLTTGATYFVSVRATNGAGLQSTMSSDGVMADGTPPTIAFVNDGADNDVAYSASTTSVTANWAASDSESDVVSYEWAIGTSPGASDAMPWQGAGASVQATASNLALVDGATYFVTVRATNGAGTSASASSNGFVPDDVPPQIDWVADGGTVDVDYQSAVDTLAAAWHASDAGAGIATFEWAVGATEGATDVLSFTSIGTVTEASAAGLSLINGTTYYVTVRATDGVGWRTVATSDGVMVDATPPAVGEVTDGPGGTDIDVQVSDTTLSASWTGFGDAQSGVADYAWCIGTTPGVDDIMAFTSVGGATSASVDTLTLVSGTSYFVTVRATNSAGLGSVGTSDGVLVDATPPIVGEVRDGTGQDIDVQGPTGRISANWSGFDDSETGITQYEWAIGCSPGADDIQPFVWLGDVGSATSGLLTLVDGATYYVAVRVTNGAGETTIGVSNGVTVDFSAVVSGTVNDGNGADVDFQAAANSVAANWSGFVSSRSPIVDYSWQVGTTAGGSDVVAPTSVGLVQSFSTSALVLQDGVRYFVTISAHCEDGTFASATSDGVTVDSSPPLPGTVADGTSEDLDVYSAGGGLAANWSGFADPGSGVVAYAWAMGTTPGGTDVQDFVDVGMATSAANTTLVVDARQTYYVSVRATNGAGLATTTSSDGVRIDGALPVAGRVNDGVDADIDFQSSTSTLTVNWSDFLDEIHGIAAYELVLGTSPGAADVRDVGGVELATSYGFDALSLEPGIAYYATVRAVSTVGVAVTASSDGVTVDTSAPHAGLVYDGAGVDLDTQASLSTLVTYWEGFTDPESHISRYEWAIGTVPGLDDVAAFTACDLETQATATDLQLSPGVTYFVTVRAWNGVGLSVAASSDGVTPDAPLASVGTSCGSSTDCATTFCVDGVCCDSACDAGPCLACAVAMGAAHDGECTAVAGRVCRTATASCDAAELCTGNEALCPVDLGTPDGTSCPQGNCRAGECVATPTEQDPGQPGAVDRHGCGCRGSDEEKPDLLLACVMFALGLGRRRARSRRPRSEA